jgi:hypothetical protein
VGNSHRPSARGLRHAFVAADEGVDHLQGHWQSQSGSDPARHTKIESTVSYRGVDVEDALNLAEHTEV